MSANLRGAGMLTFWPGRSSTRLSVKSSDTTYTRRGAREKRNCSVEPVRFQSTREGVGTSEPGGSEAPAVFRKKTSRSRPRPRTVVRAEA